MDLLLLMTYGAICIVIFKVFDLPLNKWTVPTAALGGIVLVGALVLLMNYNHPFTALARQVYVTTPIVPSVKGLVTDVPAQANTPLVAGDVLFTIDSRRYQDEVNELAAVVESKTAERDRTQTAFKRYQTGYNKGGAFTKQELDNRRQRYAAAEADLKEAEAKLRKAQYDLEETIVRAPADGYITQVALRKGVMAVPFPFSPSMMFVESSHSRVAAAFNQRSLLRVKAGYEAELIYDALPGKVIKGRVVQVLPNIAEGGFRTSSNLISSDVLRKRGRSFVEIEILEDMSKYNLPQGVHVEVAVYSDHFAHVSIMRKILLRMKSWQNYLFLEH
ncbi:HlyD family secretion protein [Ferrimonas lipolytica]|uniref:HlyD family secretion protein n=1 Tax=Ferrimonas lipolytica TaxID=2724191 RepID=A0A6H1UG48_9GAMM|nr:efflux RND transporter periplasmic adaptor subunit [Ferrimonas lipolytica]QIZ77798.1 HlyD family secretion protein [Ferrimonas lipolytica]